MFYIQFFIIFAFFAFRLLSHLLEDEFLSESIVRGSQDFIFLRPVLTKGYTARLTTFSPFILSPNSSVRGSFFFRGFPSSFSLWHRRCLPFPFATLVVRISSAFLNADQVPWHAIPSARKQRSISALRCACICPRAFSFSLRYIDECVQARFLFRILRFSDSPLSLTILGFLRLVSRNTHSSMMFYKLQEIYTDIKHYIRNMFYLK